MQVIEVAAEAEVEMVLSVGRVIKTEKLNVLVVSKTPASRNLRAYVSSMSRLIISLQDSKLPSSPGMVLLLLFFSIISASPLFPAFGVHGKHILAIVLLFTLLVCIGYRRGFKKWLVVVGGMLFIPAIIPALFWNDPRLIFLPSFLFVAILLFAQSTTKELSYYIDSASWFLLLMLIGALIGYFLARIGVSPLFEFKNPDGRLNYFFYTTFTNVYQENYIRPSGIYDEPGALSFFVCAIAFARQQMQKNLVFTWILLILGLITFSLMHLIYILIFLIGQKISLKQVKQIGIAVLLLSVLLLSTGIWSTLNNKLFSRLEIENGRIAGDNRSVLMLTAANVLNEVDHAWLFGVDTDCTFDKVSCTEKWGGMMANPLDPMVSQGLFLSWPYYIFLIAGSVSLLGGRKNFAFIAVTLLFMQRPYLLVLGYSFIGVLALWLQFCTAPKINIEGKNERINSDSLNVFT